jgi:predicted small lipoprotein YifL
VTSGTRAISTTAALLVLTAVTGCGSGGNGKVPSSQVRAYVTAVEKVRLPVNTLLNGADPILDAYHDKSITPAQASARFGAMEKQFAAYTVAMQQIDPSNSRLQALNTPYAGTYFYEDSYLATLASDLSEGDFDNLPNTQDAQRLAIVIWRTRLQVIADQSGVTLPPDIQQAGRGEIAPAIDGS